ncbi:hypothetical protein [Paenibacillus beijingensis]|uniref:hypothetical protein n=1 Tax=Paenibacillus beijingensis TaxID=1126833 RepID=UPI000A8E2F30|nr:hypothetical protein [Paenibacillus beijingensis]
MIIWSVAAVNQLAQAKVLAESVKKEGGNCRFVLCLVAEEIHPDAQTFTCFD